VSGRIIEQRNVPEGLFLGRHKNDDPRNANYPYRPRTTAVTRSVAHHLFGGILKQRAGNCTCNALAYAANAQPNHKAGKFYKESDTEFWYEECTAIDPFTGRWYRDGRQGSEDTGSDEVSACKIGVKEEVIVRYEHIEATVGNLVQVLQERPGNIGINWYEGMFNPNSNGFVEPDPHDSIAGGHEVAITEVSLEHMYFVFPQSWGRLWGQRGFGKFSFSTMERLLKEDGDLVVPIA
jgi:hypothetical protein